MINTRSLKEVLGFQKEFVLLPAASFQAREDLLRDSTARYNAIWGWFWPSEEASIPDEIPTVVLPWSAVGLDENTLRPGSEIKVALAQLLYEPTPSTYQGSIGERLEITVSVDETYQMSGSYGISTLHIFRDDSRNTYTWTTSSKSLRRGGKYTLRGTVKAHTEFNNDKQTVLTRCAIVKTWEE